MDPWWLLTIAVIVLVALCQEARIRGLERRLDQLAAGAVVAAKPSPAVAATPRRNAPVPKAAGSDLERRLGQRWLVWVGAVALAVGGIFVVQYSIERGWLGPGVRTLAGMVLGLALVVAAELLRRHPGRIGLAGAQTAQAATALAAGGVATLFGVVWAASALYGFLPPLTAIPAAALLVGLALLLAWRHGVTLAILAVVAGYGAPFVIGAGITLPNPWQLALYMVAIELLVMGTLRYRPWSWLMALDLLGILVALVLVWITGALDGRHDHLPILVVLAVATLAPVWLAGPAPAPSGSLPVRMILAALGLDGRLWLVTAILAGSAAESVRDGQGAWVFLVVMLGVLAAALAGRLPARLTAAMGGALVTFVNAFDLGPAVPADRLRPIRWLQPEHVAFAGWALALGALFLGASALASRWRRERAGLFAGIGVATSLMVLAGANDRITAGVTTTGWVLPAMALALVFLGLAEREAQHRLRREAALAAWVLGIAGAVAMGFSMALEAVWLTTGLALQFLAVCLLRRRFALPALGWIATTLAVVMVGRLLWQAGDPGARPLVEAGLATALWAYLLPVAALLAGQLLWRRVPPAWVAETLMLAALVGWIVAAVRLAAVLAGPDGADQLLPHALAAAGIATGSAMLALRPRSVASMVGLAVGGLMTVAVLARSVQAILLGPGLSVTGPPLLDSILLALFVPALAFAFVAWRERAAVPRELRAGFGTLSVAAFLAWPILEIRRGFQDGPVWGTARIGDAEGWAYSAWLVTAACLLLALGMRRRLPALRLASLGVLVLAILKVFLVDLDGMTGLWRAAAFLGLGVTLVGVGLAYQRVFTASDAAGERQAPTPGTRP